MIKTRMLSALVAGLSFAVAQPLTAATRSADSLPAASAESMGAERVGSLDSEFESLVGPPFLLIAALLGSIAAFAAAAGNGKSPG